MSRKINVKALADTSFPLYFLKGKCQPVPRRCSWGMMKAQLLHWQPCTATRGRARLRAKPETQMPICPVPAAIYVSIRDLLDQWRRLGAPD